ncbi:MAG: sulfurtransferase [Pseudomonadota bacterium]|uniref:Sulfurtransferase n=1 Tax=Sphingobium xenophagum TaxID=121428 RepID=A0A249MS74_SPHXE|nr:MULTISPECIES: sulfurtransferase [Sphingobium]ASY44216.1 sulfurtransferase [Sphingobium xenophagum]ODT93886.1 MAG: 3-mercaptopyruvate sulfurtransferase [Sphingobium sp. SCN 64-10]OUC56297.1 sulfurtransferase [Sphingobium sp. GW456-12-10-14-TSB1]QWT15493.1 sulfurtransferase [Sphingobium xenophagum]|tara:strand:+ start:1055 stop:1900 length:846 start_codon:yes stop_codon:yes gene_type:complete
MDILVSTDWLAAELGKPDLCILDASLFLPGTPRDPRAEFEAAHIPGAAFMDLPTLNDPDDPTPGMLPPDTLMTQRAQALGINTDSRVIVYDNSPTHSAARGWWMVRLYGLGASAAILDGGLPKWVAEGRATQSGPVTPATGNAIARRAPGQVRTKADLIANLASHDAQVLDARGAGRFTGEEAEPRPGMASGHIPGSRNLPSAALFNPDNSMKTGDDLRQLLHDAGIDLDRPVITTCGSGVTAAILLAGLEMLGNRDVTLYDGSWSEWGYDPATPKATGPA